MVDIVGITHSIFQIQIIVDGCHDILKRDMARDQTMALLLQQTLQRVSLQILLQNLHQYREIYLLIDPGIQKILIGQIHIRMDIYGLIAQHLDLALLCLYPDKGNPCILNLIRQFLV